MAHVDRVFGERFLRSVGDYYDYGVHLLFNDWWAAAPDEAIAKYVAAIESHPEQRALAAERWLAEPLDLRTLEPCAPGTLGEAYLRFMVDNHLEERLATGYRELHEQIEAAGRLQRMPDVLRYKVLRGYQTHDLHHVLTGYPATPLGELAVQAFGLAQMSFPYAGMWIAVVTAHMTLIEPDLMRPAMDAITDGWSYGTNSRSIQFVAFERMLDRPLAEVRKEYRLDRHLAQPQVA
jgi:ubiquinone biosynthesis protein Coq4